MGIIFTNNNDEIDDSLISLLDSANTNSAIYYDVSKTLTTTSIEGSSVNDDDYDDTSWQKSKSSIKALTVSELKTHLDAIDTLIDLEEEAGVGADADIIKALNFEKRYINEVRLTKSVDMGTNINENSVYQSIENLFLVSPSEGLYDELEFGSRLDKFLFEFADYDTAGKIYDEIYYKILKYEPRVRDLYVKILPLPDENSFDIRIEFKTNYSEDVVTFDAKLDKIR